MAATMLLFRFPQDAGETTKKLVKLPAKKPEPALTVGSLVLDLYNATFGNPTKHELAQVPKQLFSIFLKVLESQQWVYDPEKTENTNILAQPLGSRFAVNCYDLSKAFMDVAILLGIDKKEISESISHYKMSKKLGEKHPGVTGPFVCFDSKKQKEYEETQSARLFFKTHCVVNVFNRFYDLTFLSHYDNEHDLTDSSIKAEMFSAAANNNTEKLAKLLEENPEFNIQETDNKGQTFLHWAAQNDNIVIVELLLAQKIDANKANFEHEVPLQLAKNPDSPLFLLLAKHTAPDIVKQVLDSYSAIDKALAGFSYISNPEGAEFERLKNLFRPDRNFDVNQRDEGGWTLLHWAAYYNQPECMAFLLKQGADANIKNNDGSYPIDLINDPTLQVFEFLAVCTEKNKVKSKLRECRETEKSRNMYQQALPFIEKNNIRELEALLKKGLDVNAQDQMGYTLLHWAIIYKQLPMLNMLLKHKADPNIPNKDNRKPINFIFESQSEFFKLLAIFSNPESTREQLSLCSDTRTGAAP